MFHRRKHSRVDVDLPIDCTFIDDQFHRILSSLGTVHNLSVGGMMLSLPASPETLEAKLIDYSLILSKPYVDIKGNGEIRWGYWDAKEERIVFGIEFISLDADQVDSLESVVGELASENDPPY